MNIYRKISPYNHFDYNGVKYIVEHDVGTISTAKNNADFFYGGNRGASAHYFVDGLDVWQVVEDYHGAWHVGDGYGKFGISNVNSIGIEMCLQPNGKVSELTKQTTIKLTKMLQAKYNVPNSRVVRHYDASRKICPRSMSANNWAEWREFKARIDNSSAESVAKPSTPSAKPKLGKGTIGTWAVKYQTGQNISPAVKGKTYDIIQVKDVNQSHSKKAYLLGGIMSWVLEQDLVEFAKKPSAPSKPKPTESNTYFTSNPGKVKLKTSCSLYGRKDVDFKGGAVGGTYPTGTVFTISGVDKSHSGTPRLVTQSGFLLTANKKYVEAIGGSTPSKPKPKPAPSKPKLKGEDLPNKGTYKVAFNTNVRTKPVNGSVVAMYSAGESFNYDQKTISGGYVWLSYPSSTYGRVYVAVV